MFIHHGNNRTHLHNVQVAALLSLVAGMVNVAGFFAVAKLTTNVTGHFAFFMEAAFRMDWVETLILVTYVFSFFIGAICSSLLIELRTRRQHSLTYPVSVVIEALLLLMAGLTGFQLQKVAPDLLACILLFAMGFQNALVTRISGFMVRTTHLTGLFTDLGIETAQLAFYKRPEETGQLRRSIRLRLIIICGFFAGGLIAALLYRWMQVGVLTLAAAILLATLIFNVRRVAKS